MKSSEPQRFLSLSISETDPHSQSLSFLAYSPAYSQTHVTITAATAATIVYTQNAHAVWFAAGAFGATIVGELDCSVLRTGRCRGVDGHVDDCSRSQDELQIGEGQQRPRSGGNGVAVLAQLCRKVKMSAWILSCGRDKRTTGYILVVCHHAPLDTIRATLAVCNPPSSL